MTDEERVEPIFDNPERKGGIDNYQSMELSTARRLKKRDLDEESDTSWTEDIEEYIKTILKKCQDAEEAHNGCGYSMKTKHAFYAFPAMLIPTISAPVMGTFKDDEWAPYFGMSAMVVTAIFSGFSNFFNYGSKSQMHFNFAGRYGDIVTDIEETLHKKHDRRISAHVAMRTYKMKMDALNLSAPET